MYNHIKINCLLFHEPDKFEMGSKWKEKTEECSNSKLNRISKLLINKH